MNSKCYCIFSAQFLPHLGGVEKYTYNLAKKLVEKGNAVTVVSANVERAKTYEVMDGIQIYRMPCFSFLHGRFPIPNMNRQFWKIHRRISSKKYDVVIVNTRFYIHSLYGALFGKKRKGRCVFVEHGTGHLDMGNKYINFIEKIYEHFITAVEKLLCKEFYGVSEACLEWLRHFHIEGKGVFYNAIDINEAEEAINSSSYSYRKELKIPKGAIVVTFTGRLIKEKGIYQLIKAVSGLNKKGKRIYLIIAGDGEEKERIDRMCNENIVALGKISHELIMALLKETDVFCLPTEYPEGLPTSILEAAVCKNYIITTEKGGAKELLLDESYGMVLKSNDVLSVSRALERAIENPQIRKETVERTYCRLKEKFTWDIVAESVMKL